MPAARNFIATPTVVVHTGRAIVGGGLSAQPGDGKGCKQMAKTSDTIRVIVFKDDDLWVAPAAAERLDARLLTAQRGGT